MSENVTLLNDHGRRALDEVIRENIRKPGVCCAVLKLIMPLCSYDLTPERIVWLDGQLQPKKRTWSSDLVGQLSDGSIIHIDQEPWDHADIGIRMLGHGSHIAMNHKLARQVSQVFLCTDRQKPPGYEHGKTIVNDYGAVRNSFQFFYAGDFNAEALRGSSLFTVASMGLLSEHIDNLPSFIDELIERAYREFDGNRLTRHLVSCILMASLWRRAQIFFDAIPRSERDEVLADPYINEVLDVRRGRAISFLNLRVSKCAITIPNDFVIWLSRHTDLILIKDVASSLNGAIDFDDLTLLHRIDWQPEDGFAQSVVTNEANT